MLKSLLKAQETQYRRWRDRKSQEGKEYCETLCSGQDIAVTLTNSNGLITCIGDVWDGACNVLSWREWGGRGFTSSLRNQ